MSWSEASRHVGRTVGAHEVVVIHLREFMVRLLEVASDDVKRPEQVLDWTKK